MSRPGTSDPRVGTELAGYLIEGLLGRGGMSVVYLAEDLRLHRKVALKLIAPELAEDERFRERFLAESELAASLAPPNVVPISAPGAAPPPPPRQGPRPPPPPPPRPPARRDPPPPTPPTPPRAGPADHVY